MNKLFLLLTVFISCESKKGNFKQSRFEKYPKILDSSVQRLKWQDEMAANCKLFNLPVLSNGADSFELRIWPWHAFDPTKRVLVFKLGQHGWDAYNYNSYSNKITEQDRTELTPPDPKKLGANVFLAKRIFPKSGWKSFSDSLALSQIQTLPTEWDIKGYKKRLFLDGYGFVFEVATKTSHRVLSYDLPYSCEYDECRKIVGLLEMLKREFELDYCWPNCGKAGETNPLAPN